LAVHRLDFETSGLMVVALDAAAHRHLSRQFEERHVEKAYVAVLDGLVGPESGEVRMRIRVDWDARPRQMVCEVHGRDSHTRYRVLERGDGRTRVEFTPITGRSHQLRVHSAFSPRVGGLGCAILGDPLYASGAARDYSRLCLHATRLAFTHPVRGERVEFSSTPPF
jgi:tRNA pseudouridine32 synthase/23S rRNA pseudouridine746 synthase